jgi:Flp pilus assembly protein TadD
MTSVMAGPVDEAKPGAKRRMRKKVGPELAEAGVDAVAAPADGAEAPPPPRRRKGRRSRIAEPAPALSAPSAGAPPASDPLAEHLARAAAFAERGSHADAADAYATLAAEHPNHLRALLGLSTVLAAQGKYEAAEKELRRALKVAPDDPEVHHLLGSTLFKRGVYPAAVASLRRAIELDRSNVAAHVVLGEALNQLAESDAAIQVLEEALRLQPSAKAYYAMGIALDRKGSFDRAAEMYRLSRDVARR